jgi:hypothetical protein
MRSKFYLSVLGIIMFCSLAAGQVTDAENPQNIDVTWETLIALKVNEYISLNLNTVLQYDDDIKVPVDRNGNSLFESTEAPGPRTQFKEIFGVGFSNKF